MAAPGAHRPGVFAQVVGLAQTPLLNGEVGQLVRLTEAGRWVVRTGSGLKAIKPQNLFPAADEVPESARRMLASAAAVTAYFMLELARSGGSRPFPVVAVPILLVVWTIATLLGSQWLHQPLTLPEAKLPGLWQLGIAPPARGIFRFGSATVAILLTCTVRLHQGLLLQPELSIAQLAGHAKQCSSSGYFAALGFAMQGLFSPQADSRLSLGMLLHVLGALCFLISSAWHTRVSLLIAGELSQSYLAQSLLFRLALALRTLLAWSLPVVAVVALGALTVLQIRACKSATNKDILPEESIRCRIISSLAMHQWVLTLHFAFFYSTYLLDFLVVLGTMA
eukprot:TRINITY_DN105415_c0_g1_i1.p1 TRINITY_DN105415_c0_g1~~TRINITY_DN105415_c0_g1_i1.p1  ORF type:complete len:354 (-),score=59.02 TRINITY_DN105415_c0_g1_i1:88-1098(-)